MTAVAAVVLVAFIIIALLVISPIRKDDGTPGFPSDRKKDR